MDSSDAPDDTDLNDRKYDVGAHSVPQGYLMKGNLQRLPSQWLQQYGNFVRSNAATVTQVESALRSIVYILPGRFHQTPVAAESLNTFLVLLTNFHTHLLTPSIESSSLRSTPHSRYDHWARARSVFYTRAVGILRTIQYTQLLLEMFAKRAGEKMRWRVVVLLEVIKALCRFLMLRLTRLRPVVSSEINADTQERMPAAASNIDSNSDLEYSRETQSTDASAHPREEPRESIPDYTTPYKMPRTGITLPSLPSPSLGHSISAYLDSHILTPDELKSPSKLVHQLQSLRAVTGESLWILRPVIYALALQHFQGQAASRSGSPHQTQRRARDWAPWLIGLSMELLSRELSKRSVDEEVPGGWRALSAVERDETQRRNWSLAWWGMRGAFYERVTGKWLRGLVAKGKGKFGLDLLTGVVEDYEWAWGEYYFSTATV